MTSQPAWRAFDSRGRVIQGDGAVGAQTLHGQPVRFGVGFQAAHVVSVDGRAEAFEDALGAEDRFDFLAA